MRYKLTFAVGVAVGYVLGAHAGRERYEQIVQAGRSFVENPSVQETAGLVGSKATDLMGQTRRRVTDKVGDKLPFASSADAHAPQNGRRQS